MNAPTLSRRLLVGIAGAAALGELLRAWPAIAAQLPFLPERLPPAPPGARMQPHTELEWTLWWLAETIVPGTATDPSGAPGANDCGALNVMLDPLLPLAANAPLVATLLDGAAQERFDADFRELPAYEQRAEVAATVEKRLPLMTLLYRLIRATFYGAAYDEIGTRWMGFPGESLGYIDHPDFTLGQPIGRELTRDGHMP